MMPKAKTWCKSQKNRVVVCEMFKKYTKKVLSNSTSIVIRAFKWQKMNRLTMVYIFYTPVE